MTEVGPGYARLATEQRNPNTAEIDTCSSLRILEQLNAEDALVPAAVRAVLPSLATVVDIAAERIGRGGRVHYFGAGTSGRLAVLDAAELLPTFSVEPGLVVAHHAGGEQAIADPEEDVEDSTELGAREAEQLQPTDLAIGITASGRTPFVAGALRQAGRRGASTVLLSSVPEAAIAELADVHIAAETGPEAIAGSTRLKAGSAAKLMLNAFSTALMVRLGRTYSNLMVSVTATNSKLQDRVLGILAEATGLPTHQCRTALAAADGDLKTALITVLGACSAGHARRALTVAEGSVRTALEHIAAEAGPPGNAYRSPR